MIGYGCGLVFAGQIVYSFLICLNIVPEMPVILPFCHMEEVERCFPIF